MTTGAVNRGGTKQNLKAAVATAMAFGDVALTIAILRLALPIVTVCIGAPISLAAHRHQPGRRLTRAVSACYALAAAAAAARARRRARTRARRDARGRGACSWYE